MEVTDAEVLHEIARRVANACHPRSVILFGSRATGGARPESDYDLLIVWKDEAPPGNRAATVRRALRGLSASFDIAVVTPSEFELYKGRTAHVVGIAAREGRVLYAA
jgi:uncharacterized protein